MPESQNNSLDRQIIGYALEKMPVVPDQAFQMQVEMLGRIEKTPDEFGAPYDQAVIDEYEALIAEAKGEGLEQVEYGTALNVLMRNVKKGDEGWVPIDLTKRGPRSVFARALLALQDLPSRAGEVGGGLVTDPQQMGPWERQKYIARVFKEMREQFGLNEDFDTDYLLSLLGEVSKIAPSEMASIQQLIAARFSMFKNKFTDEQLVFLEAYERREGGNTDAGLQILADLSEMTMDKYGEALSMIQPNELFFLAHMPFVLKDASGNEVSITIAEVTDFLHTPKGKRYFRMTPHERAVHGVSAYIDFLKNKYPDANQGLRIISRFKVIDEETGGKRAAGVLDEGKAGLEGDEKPYVTMATNPTWLRIFKAAVACSNILTNRSELYPGGAVFGLGAELQKSANAWPHYLNAYKMYDGSTRQSLLRFRSAGEYWGAAINPLDFFGGLSSETPDIYNPFHPRPMHERNWGVGALEDRSDRDRALDLRWMTSLFFAVEPDPASTQFEEAVQEVVAAGSDYYVDLVGDRKPKPRMTDDEQVKLAWEWRRRLEKELGKQVNTSDKRFETLFRFRAFYPLSPETIRRILKFLPEDIEERMNKYNFIDKERQYRVVEPSADRVGLSGMKAVVKAMGSGIWSRPNFGKAQKNSTQKHAGYEAMMVDIYKGIVAMMVESTQAKTGQLEEIMHDSAAYGRQDLAERGVKALDRLVQESVLGVRAIPSIRAESWEAFIKAFGETALRMGIIGNSKGIWWLYRRACVVGDYMAGLPTMLPYISGDTPYRFVKGKKVHNPVMPMQGLASFAKTYNLDAVSADALAVLGCHFDTEIVTKTQPDGTKLEMEVRKGIIYPGRAAGLHPIAMTQEGDDYVVDPLRVNIANEYGHKRQIPRNSAETQRLIREELFEFLLDLNLETVDSERYFNPHSDKSGGDRRARGFRGVINT